ncbi:uncharacterized protein ACA1_324950 [Acanthamoeba castellanii str. Neff]|uniref:Uncharacterized protein n=1 Tax=Acanthamoeba castellanii (strain ATCC 30010 / Neff) TaxID=1257118 RepID=L8GI67_ACACF|nr:uncharacterized protein ACA1_324950 [Acanthamoeba castellanii str. Neff]ELR12448.1 hypothetical protein ACA1_324950 [Acanthamoeba castellanii str. Neff]
MLHSSLTESDIYKVIESLGISTQHKCLAVRGGQQSSSASKPRLLLGAANEIELHLTPDPTLFHITVISPPGFERCGRPSSFVLPATPKTEVFTLRWALTRLTGIDECNLVLLPMHELGFDSTRPLDPSATLGDQGITTDCPVGLALKRSSGKHNTKEEESGSRVTIAVQIGPRRTYLLRVQLDAKVSTNRRTAYRRWQLNGVTLDDNNTWRDYSVVEGTWCRLVSLPRSFQLFVKGLTGKTITIECGTSMLVGELKQKICYKEVQTAGTRKEPKEKRERERE